MDWNRQLCVIIYSLILIQCTLTLAMTYFKVNKSATLYVLNVTHILTMMWLVFGMHEIQSHNTEELLFAVRLTLFPMSFLSGTWLIFTLMYSGLIRSGNRLIFGIILIPQAITYAPLMTNRWFHLAIVYKNYSDPGQTIWGPAMQINFNISYLYLVLSFLVLLYHAHKTFKDRRLKVIMLALSPLIPFITNVVFHYKILPDPGFDVTPVTFSVMLLVQALATFRYKAFDQLHHGAVDVYQNIDESLIIVDDQHHIVDFNNSAEKEIKQYLAGFDTDDIRPYLHKLREHTTDPSPINSILEAINHKWDHHRVQLILNQDKERRYYDFYLKRILNRNGKATGYLLSFKNRTEQSKALLETEHRRISRDIHDGLNNLVNVVSMNLEYALKDDLLQGEVRDCIEVAFTTNSRMRFEIRKILDELVPLDIEKNGLLNALNSLFKRVQGTGVEIDFTSVGIDDQLNHNLSLGLMLYSTCLEGINNAMYNGKAKNISIVINKNDRLVRFVLSDDGHGCKAINYGRGLEGIEQRATANGGKVIFESEPDNGFSIMMEVPIDDYTNDN